jgi:hypothetical protein
MIFSGFRIESEFSGANIGGDFHRLIGNDIIGVKNKHGSGTGIINTGKATTHTGDGNVVLGNAVHGGGSKDRYDHAIYISGCSDNTGTKLGWNYCYDNDFGRGPILSINHQQERCTGDQVLDAHFIFNNIIDCTRQRAVGINVYDLSYDDGEEIPEPSYVYNNIFINSGTYDDSNPLHIGYAPAMKHNAAGHARFYNNTFYNAGYVGLKVSNQVLSTHYKNNIVYMSPDFPGPSGDNYYVSIDNESGAFLSNNLYYGLGSYPNCDNCVMDENNVSNQIPTFVDPTNFNFEPQSDSPVIDAGTDDLLFEVAPPDYAPIDRDLNFLLRGNTPAIGAYEYATTTLSLNDFNSLSEFLIFPNPTKGDFQINTNNELSELKIYNSLGQLIKEISIVENQISVKLPVGIYLLVLKAENNRISSKKLIVQ